MQCSRLICLSLVQPRCNWWIREHCPNEHLLPKDQRRWTNATHKGVLALHVLCIVYQGSIWMYACSPHIDLPRLEDHGLVFKDEKAEPLWITKPTIKVVIQLDVKCHCTKGRCVSCKFSNADLKCTRLCTCPCINYTMCEQLNIIVVHYNCLCYKHQLSLRKTYFVLIWRYNSVNILFIHVFCIFF